MVDRPEREPGVDGRLRQYRRHPRHHIRVRAPVLASHRPACAALFDAIEGLGHRRWVIAKHLCHGAGLHCGELIALQAHDIEFNPARVVHVRRAVEQPTRGPARLKPPKTQPGRRGSGPTAG